MVEFEAIRGLIIVDVDVDHAAPSTWGVTLKLPDSLARGESLDTGLRVRVPAPRALNPYMVLAPIRPTRRARVSVDFGDSGLAREAWLLDEVFPSDLTLHPRLMAPASAVIDVAAHPVVAGGFDRPRIGFAYGVAWLWSD